MPYRWRCCFARLVDPQLKCSVRSCGLLASGLSHLAVIKEWYDTHPEERALMVFEDDAAPSVAFVMNDTIQLMQNPPADWGFIKLQDCQNGMYNKYVDETCKDTDGCNAWRRVSTIRSFFRGAACVTSYAITRERARQLFQWHNESTSLFAALAHSNGVWWDPPSGAPIENLVNVLTWGPWENVSYQPILNPFKSNVGIPGGGGGSDNHPTAERVMGTRDWTDEQEQLEFLRDCEQPYAQRTLCTTNGRKQPHHLQPDQQEDAQEEEGEAEDEEEEEEGEAEAEAEAEDEEEEDGEETAEQQGHQARTEATSAFGRGEGRVASIAEYQT
jgi:hypothetical protein